MSPEGFYIGKEFFDLSKLQGSAYREGFATGGNSTENAFNNTIFDLIDGINGDGKDGQLDKKEIKKFVEMLKAWAGDNNLSAKELKDSDFFKDIKKFNIKTFSSFMNNLAEKIDLTNQGKAEAEKYLKRIDGYDYINEALMDKYFDYNPKNKRYEKKQKFDETAFKNEYQKTMFDSLINNLKNNPQKETSNKIYNKGCGIIYKQNEDEPNLYEFEFEQYRDLFPRGWNLNDLFTYNIVTGEKSFDYEKFLTEACTTSDWGSLVSIIKAKLSKEEPDKVKEILFDFLCSVKYGNESEGIQESENVEEKSPSAIKFDWHIFNILKGVVPDSLKKEIFTEHVPEGFLPDETSDFKNNDLDFTILKNPNERYGLDDIISEVGAKLKNVPYDETKLDGEINNWYDLGQYAFGNCWQVASLQSLLLGDEGKEFVNKYLLNKNLNSNNEVESITIKTATREVEYTNDNVTDLVGLLSPNSDKDALALLRTIRSFDSIYGRITESDYTGGSFVSFIGSICGLGDDASLCHSLSKNKAISFMSANEGVINNHKFITQVGFSEMVEVQDAKIIDLEGNEETVNYSLVPNHAYTIESVGNDRVNLIDPNKKSIISVPMNAVCNYIQLEYAEIAKMIEMYKKNTTE